MTNVLIVGCGLSGSTMANLIAKNFKNIKIDIIEKRNHIGGNVFDYIEEETNTRVSKYGANLFHTNDENIWNYLQEFGDWIRWEHKVLAFVDGKYVPVPVNSTTINMLENENICNEDEAKEWFKNNTENIQNPTNSEEVCLSKVGNKLYNKLFKYYTFKQWNKFPDELDPLVLNRIPVRINFDDRYFNDKFQALPRDGYTKIVENMLKFDNINVMLNTSWEDFSKYKDKYDLIIFTGPIDHYFKNNNLPKLEYRSIDFIKEIKNCEGYYQLNSVINYPEINIEYTRTVEYKHFLHQKSSKTILIHEKTTDDGEPYYPVPNDKNIKLYLEYKELANKEQKVHFLGRLASYKYFNMDQAIKNSIDYFMDIIKPVLEK